MGKFFTGVAVVVTAAFTLKGISAFIMEVVKEMDERKEAETPAPAAPTASASLDE